jgi:class 3 adenylate cyclase
MPTSADYHYRQERFFSQSPQAVWPFVSDTARFNELAGLKPYTVEERVDSQGRVRRFARGNAGPLPTRWEEGYGEWRENRQWTIVREFQTGPMRRMEVSTELRAEGDGCRLLFAVDAETSGPLGLIAKSLGLLDRECAKIFAAIEQLIHEGEPSESRSESRRKADLIEPDARARLNVLAAELAPHALTANLIHFLNRAPTVSLRGMRPLELARRWHASPDHVVELFLAAAHRGILVMGWDLLCPRCRGAKSRVATLHDLPEGAHCSSCNIDYQRNFSSNVELTFRPASWLRPLPEGEFCLLGPGSAPHVKFQAEVAARSSKTYDVTLEPGPYRFRTVEAGGEADADISPDDAMPAIIARGAEIVEIRLEAASSHNQLAIRNETDRPLYFVIEDRNWIADALTGDRVTAMPVFRRLCPEQLLRPGDDAEIGRITILFTDLVGSTSLYDSLGDATAYNLVRDHFAFLSERVERHNGFIVKTVGDAVMAAFSHSDDAVRAALAVQDDVAAFNSANRAGAIALKLGLHSGACIAVTAAGVLDYFGATVNIAARLEHQCAAGEVVVSGVILDDPATNAALDGRSLREDQAILRGFNAPLRFVRVKPVAGKSVV